MLASILMGLNLCLTAQQLDVQGNANLVTEGEIVLGGNLNNLGTINIQGTNGSLVVLGSLTNDGNLGIASQEGLLQLQGDFENNASFSNSGKLSLAGDILSAGTQFNTIGGELEFIGNATQNIVPTALNIGVLTLNMGANSRLPLNQTNYIITNQLNLNSGVLVVDETAQLIIEDGATVTPGSSNSFVQGRMTHLGSGDKLFPLGLIDGPNGQQTYAELILRNANDGGSFIYSADYSIPNTPLNPDRLLLGVSAGGIWQMDLSGASTDNAQIELTYENQDLSFQALSVFNDLRHSFRTAAVVVSDTLEGPYTALPLPDDVVQYEEDEGIPSDGVVRADTTIQFIEGQTKFIGIGVTPIVEAGGVVYLPTVFSPRASDPLNQRFRVFFEEKDEFREVVFEVYNRFGEQVYRTIDLLEAGDIGWDGTNSRTGRDSPTGTYFYSVSLLREDGTTFAKQGSVYLQR